MQQRHPRRTRKHSHAFTRVARNSSTGLCHHLNTFLRLLKIISRQNTATTAVTPNNFHIHALNLFSFEFDVYCGTDIFHLLLLLIQFIFWPNIFHWFEQRCCNIIDRELLNFAYIISEKKKQKESTSFCRETNETRPCIIPTQCFNHGVSRGE